jgi:hypothetical protein
MIYISGVLLLDWLNGFVPVRVRVRSNWVPSPRLVGYHLILYIFSDQCVES